MAFSIAYATQPSCFECISPNCMPRRCFSSEHAWYACACALRKAIRAAFSRSLNMPRLARCCASFLSSTSSASQFWLAVAASTSRVSWSDKGLLSILGLDAEPALFDRRQQRGHLVDQGRIERDAGRIQAPGAVLVQTAQIGDDFAAILEIERARQSVNDFRTFVQADGLLFIALADDMSARARQFFQQAVGEQQDQFDRGGARRLRIQVDGVVVTVCIVIHHFFSL